MTNELISLQIEQREWVRTRDELWCEKFGDTVLLRWADFRKLREISIHHIIPKSFALHYCKFDPITVNFPENVISIDNDIHHDTIHSPEYSRLGNTKHGVVAWNARWDSYLLEQARIRTEWYYQAHGAVWPHNEAAFEHIRQRRLQKERRDIEAEYRKTLTRRIID